MHGGNRSLFPVLEKRERLCYFSPMAKDLYAEIVDLRSRGARAALASIIVTKGATPRKDSSKMLVYEDGRRSGTIGGGFTEAEVCREALKALKTGRPKLLSFDLTGVNHEEVSPGERGQHGRTCCGNQHVSSSGPGQPCGACR